MGLMDFVKKEQNIKAARAIINAREDEFLEQIRKVHINNDLVFYRKKEILEELKTTYSDVLNDSFIGESLKKGKWFVLDIVDENYRKEYLIKSFTAYANGYNKEIEERLNSPEYRQKIEDLMQTFNMEIEENPLKKIYKADAYSYFPESLFKDKDFIRNSLAIFPDLIQKAPLEIQNDKEFIKSLVKMSLESSANDFSYIPREYFKDEAFIRDIIREVPFFVSHIDYKLQENEKFIDSLVDINPKVIIGLDEDDVTGKQMLKLINENEYMLDNYTKSNHGILFDKISSKFYNLLEKDKAFALEIIDRGYIEHFCFFDLYKIDDDVKKALFDKFQEFDISADYNIDKLKSNPNVFASTLGSIDFRKEREILRDLDKQDISLV